MPAATPNMPPSRLGKNAATAAVAAATADAAAVAHAAERADEGRDQPDAKQNGMPRQIQPADARCRHRLSTAAPAVFEPCSLPRRPSCRRRRRGQILRRCTPWSRQCFVAELLVAPRPITIAREPRTIPGQLRQNASRTSSLRRGERAHRVTRPTPRKCAVGSINENDEPFVTRWLLSSSVHSSRTPPLRRRFRLVELFPPLPRKADTSRRGLVAPLAVGLKIVLLAFSIGLSREHLAAVLHDKAGRDRAGWAPGGVADQDQPVKAEHAEDRRIRSPYRELPGESRIVRRLPPHYSIADHSSNGNRPSCRYVDEVERTSP